MISRVWRGVARSTEADNYVRHLQREIFPQFSRISGFVSASISAVGEAGVSAVFSDSANVSTLG